MTDERDLEVRLATHGDVSSCATTLAAAFRDYPWTRHVVPPDDYGERLRALQLAYLDYATEQGFVAVAGPAAGVAALIRPRAAEPDAAFLDRVIELHGDRIDRLDGAPFPAEAWRLETLGVDPGRQGFGIASSLLRFALDEVARRDGTIVMLDTSDARNVRLYERHGFRTISRRAVESGPSVWRMTTDVRHRTSS